MAAAKTIEVAVPWSDDVVTMRLISEAGLQDDIIDVFKRCRPEKSLTRCDTVDEALIPADKEPAK